ncbi:MAG: toxin, partial [Bacteroidota bacterium]
HAWSRDRQPNYALNILRETHVSEENGTDPKTQISFSYSDGFGQALMVKVQAEPGDAFRLDQNGQLVNDHAANRWVGNGRTVYNNKGNPVRQYEPYFSHSFSYESESKLVEYGVSPTLQYDPLGRNIQTDLPDGTLTKVVFTPWRQESWDQNDTILESQWYLDRGSPDPLSPEPSVVNNPQNYARRAAWLASQNANTPKVEHLDTLGRVFQMDDDNGSEGVYSTKFHLDILGQQREVVDAKDRLITRNHFNMAGEPIHTESMDAGRRWMLNNAMGSPLYQWNDRNFRTRMEFDELQRNTATFIQEGTAQEQLVYFLVYGERFPQPEQSNHYGQLYQLYDQAGRINSLNFDFKGNLLSREQQVCIDYKNTIDWSDLHGLSSIVDIDQAASSILENETFTTAATFDALSRPLTQTAPDNSQTLYIYNEANFLEKIQTYLRGSNTLTDFVRNINYDAKGQRTKIQYGNGVSTTYEYDPLTFRLMRLRSTRQGGGGSEVLQDLQYHYDPVGNITDLRDDAQQILFFQNTVVEPHSSYTYDALYRLKTAKGREHPGQHGTTGQTHEDLAPRSPIPHAQDGQAMRRYTRSYIYDEMGNMMELKHQAAAGGWTRSYEYLEPSLLETRKHNNRLSKTTSSGLTVSYAHDIHGNITSMPTFPLWIGTLPISSRR